MRGFAELPAQIAELTREHERLSVVLLDAFGWEFVQRTEHPLLERLEIEPIASQFPSTTAAHLTTLYTGLPVAEHGLYEWQIYEPSLDTVILPLPFVDWRGEPLAIDPSALVPSTFWQTLDAPCTVLQPSRIWPSRYSSAAFAGAEVIAFESYEEGVALLGTRPGLTYLYWDAIDYHGHRHGPDSPEFERAIRRALDGLLDVPGPLLVTADHGQLAVGEIDLLDELWPELPLRLPPAGSARDCFLHVDEPERVVHELASRLEERAEVVLAAELFPDAGERLRARLADVCVLPAPGRMAWVGESPQLRFRGHHGGRTAAESTTWVGLLL